MARRKEGAFVEIKLKNGMYAYGRVLTRASFAFYDIYSKEKITDISQIKNKKVMFINSVYNHAVTKNKWKIIGMDKIDPELETLPNEFMQDLFDYSKFRIYNPNTGDIRPAKKEECLGLERAAVWEPEHIEDRLLDYFENRPNDWVEGLKIKE